MATDDIRNYCGPMGEHTNISKYNDLDKKVSAPEGTTLYVGNTPINASLSGAFTPAEPHVPEMVKNVFTGMDAGVKGAASAAADFLTGPFKDETDSSLSPAPTYKKELAFTIKDKVGSSIQGIVNNPNTQGAVDAISSSIGTVGSAMGTGLGAINTGVSTIASPVGKGITTLNSYIGPTVKTLDNFAKIGDEFDKIIKDTFLGQIFNIRGPEVICIVFCIIISFLPCSIRNKLAKAISDAQKTMKQVQAAASAVNEMVGVYNATMAGANAVTEAASGLFGNKNTSTLLNTPFKSTSNGMSAIGGASVVISAPTEVKNIVDQLTKALQMVTKARITIPTGINGDIWDLAQLVLFSLQSMVMQMADEMLTKIIKPIEDALKKMTPQICIGNMATIFFNKIIATIRAFKAWILQQIAELFGSSKAFGLKWKTFGIYFKGLLDLLALLQALNIVLKNFFDLAMACGISPCEETRDGRDNSRDEDRSYQSLVAAVRSGNDAPLTNIPAERLNYNAGTPLIKKPTNNSKNLDIIAEKLAPILKIPTENIVITSDEILIAQPGFDNAPKMIASLIASEQFALELGPAYKIYSTPDGSSVKVVYTFKRSCGE